MNIATAYVEVRYDTRKGEAEARAAVSKTGKSLGRQFGEIFGAVAFGAGIKQSIGAASDLNEQVNRSKNIFGDAERTIESYAKTSARSMGLSKEAFRDATSTLGGLLQNLGLTREESLKWSVDLTKLGSDLGSAFNKDPAIAVEAIGSALRGESEPIRAFNVVLDDARLKAKALEMGLYDGVGALDANAKAQATLQLILDQTTTSQGDFARTANDAANAQRVSKALAEDSAASLGQSFLPVYERVVQIVGVLAEKFGELPAPLQVATVALIGIVALAGPIGKVIDVAKELTTAFKALGTSGKGLATALGVVGVALAAAITLYTVFAGRTSEAEEASRGFTEALQAEAAGQRDAIAAQIAREVADRRYVAVIDKLGLSTAEIADVINGKTVPAYEAVRAKLDAIMDPAVSTEEQVRRLSDEFGIGREEAMRFTGTTDALREGLALARSEFEFQQQVQAEVTGGMEKGTEATKAATTATYSNAEANEYLSMLLARAKAATEAETEAQRKSNDMHAKANSVLQQLRLSLVAYYSAAREAVDSQYAFEAAVDRTDDAVAAYNETVKENGAQSEEASDQLRDTRNAIIETSLAYVKMKGANLESAEGVAAQVDALRIQQAQLEPGSELWNAIELYIAQLERIPRDINTRIGSTIVGTAGSIRGGIDPKTGKPRVDPEMDHGGVVPGARGSPQRILAHGGEVVLPTHRSAKEAADEFFKWYASLSDADRIAFDAAFGKDGQPPQRGRALAPAGGAAVAPIGAEIPLDTMAKWLADSYGNLLGVKPAAAGEDPHLAMLRDLFTGGDGILADAVGGGGGGGQGDSGGGSGGSGGGWTAAQVGEHLSLLRRIANDPRGIQIDDRRVLQTISQGQDRLRGEQS